MKVINPVDAPGYFWLPENPNYKLPGVLKISEVGDIEVRITSLYSGKWDSNVESLIGDTLPWDGIKKHNRIVGVVDTEVPHQYVTLEDCIYIGKSIPLPNGIASAHIRVNRAFIGVHSDTAEEVNFSRIRFCVEGLDEWLGESSTKVVHRRGEKGELEVQVDFSPLEKKTYSASCDGMEVEFDFSYTIPPGANVAETKITQKAYISLRSPNLHSFDEFRSLLSKLQNFLCFAIGHTVSLTSVEGDSSKIGQKLDNGRILLEPTKIYYKSIPTSESNVNFHQYDLLLPFQVISDQFDGILTQWLTRYDEIEHALNRYFTVMFGASEYLEIRFLLLTQGIEILHRKLCDKAEMNQEEFENLIDTVVKCAPKNKRKWLNDKLRFANELSLRIRLKEMLKPFFYLYNTNGDIKSFVNSIVNTRNYLTHSNSDLMSKSVEGGQLYVLIQNLEVLFQLRLLQFIGLDRKQIEELAESQRVIRKKLQVVC